MSPTSLLSSWHSFFTYWMSRHFFAAMKHIIYLEHLSNRLNFKQDFLGLEVVWWQVIRKGKGKRVFHEIMAFLILDEEAVEAPSFQNHWPDWGCACLSMNVRRHIPVTMGWFPHFPHLVGCDLGIVWYSIAMNWTSKRWEFWKMENPHPFVALALPLGASIVTKGQKTSPKCWKFILLMVRRFGANNSSLLYMFLFQCIEMKHDDSRRKKHERFCSRPLVLGSMPLVHAMLPRENSVFRSRSSSQRSWGTQSDQYTGTPDR